MEEQGLILFRGKVYVPKDELRKEILLTLHIIEQTLPYRDNYPGSAGRCWSSNENMSSVPGLFYQNMC